MLTLCMTGLPAAQLDAIVERQLAPFGRAASIRVMPPKHSGGYGAITVKMSTLAAAHHLARELGDSQFGCIVIIRLLLIDLVRQRSA